MSPNTTQTGQVWKSFSVSAGSPVNGVVRQLREARDAALEELAGMVERGCAAPVRLLSPRDERDCEAFMMLKQFGLLREVRVDGDPFYVRAARVEEEEGEEEGE